MWSPVELFAATGLFSMIRWTVGAGLPCRQVQGGRVRKVAMLRAQASPLASSKGHRCRGLLTAAPHDPAFACSRAGTDEVGDLEAAMALVLMNMAAQVASGRVG